MRSVAGVGLYDMRVMVVLRFRGGLVRMGMEMVGFKG